MSDFNPSVVVFESSVREGSWGTAYPPKDDNGYSRWKTATQRIPVLYLDIPDNATLDRARMEIARNQPSRVVMLGKKPEEMAFFRRLSQSLDQPADTLVLALRGRKLQDNEILEQRGADFVISNLSEAVALTLTPPFRKSVTVLLLAYNEEALLEKAVMDVHVFCRMYIPNYKIIIVDDGSTDGTAALARQLSEDRVRIITHSDNMGMGASMKDGYDATTTDYVVSLPGDGQVKAHSLAAFLTDVEENTVVLSRYPVPHSGVARAVMSAAFRRMLRHVGKLSVDVAGAYLFSTRLYERARLPQNLASNTFLFSFQLLESMKRHGAAFSVVDVVPFPRTVGQSREARAGRIVKMMQEIVRHRLLDRWITFWAG